MWANLAVLCRGLAVAPLSFSFFFFESKMSRSFDVANADDVSDVDGRPGVVHCDVSVADKIDKSDPIPESERNSSSLKSRTRSFAPFSIFWSACWPFVWRSELSGVLKDRTSSWLSWCPSSGSKWTCLIWGTLWDLTSSGNSSMEDRFEVQASDPDLSLPSVEW